jgi:aryl-alcohol dehydrogenase-like predicted oxidoreductase
MEYTRLGNSGLKVSRLCLGTMMFGRWGNPDPDDCVRIIHRALDEGITFIDTANRYNWGESEDIVGKALRGKRDSVVLATKVFMPGMGGGLDRGTSRRHIMLQVEESLRRMNTDWIDLYQLHRNDKDTPIEESIAALTDLVRQGKVRYLGVSTGHASDPVELQWSGWRMVESLWIAERRNQERYICTQPPYSIFSRDVEREIFPVCERFGFGAIVWSPLEGGWLAGRYRKGQPPPPDSRAANETEFGMFVRDNFTLDSPRGQHRLEVVEELVRMADELGVSLTAYATAWVLHHRAVSCAIVGPRVSHHLDASFEALGVKIPDAHLARIDELVPPGTRL